MVCVNLCIDFEKARQKRKREAADEGEVERGPVFGIATTSRLWVILKLAADGKSFQRSDEMTLPLFEIARKDQGAIGTANKLFLILHGLIAQQKDDIDQWHKRRKDEGPA